MIKRIIFLTISPFNKRDFRRFGIELLMKNGFEVEVWELTNILFPDIARNYLPPDSIDWPGCKVFSDKNFALRKLKSLDSDTFIVPFFHYTKKCYTIYKAISISKAKYASFMVGALPFSENKRRLGKILCIFKKLKKRPFRKIVNFTFNKMPFRWLRIKPVSLILAGGTESLKYPDPIANTTEILWAHTLDYDLYLEEKNKHFTRKPIAVFIDEYVPFHPDYIYMGVKPFISADKYYPLLNKLFNLIENQLGLKVIIAAHPRSHYEELPDYFESRECVRGQTIKLVKEAKLLLAHSSTALSFANLFYKPVIFITSSELNRSYQGPLIFEMARLFGKKPIFIDKNETIDWEFELTVNKNIYNNYRGDYIKTKHSEDLPFWQIVANRLKEGF